HHKYRERHPHPQLWPPADIAILVASEYAKPSRLANTNTLMSSPKPFKKP
ncbi:hypothetical protein E2562_006926, partial [Oryza meyeriana var. granulata]